MAIRTMFVTKANVTLADLDGDATRAEYLHARKNEGDYRGDNKMEQAELDLADEINRNKVEVLTDNVVCAYYAINGVFPPANFDVVGYIGRAKDHSLRENLYYAIKAVKYLNNKGLLNFGPAQTQDSIDYFTANPMDAEDIAYWRNNELEAA
jgi:hypothetical protein